MHDRLRIHSELKIIESIRIFYAQSAWIQQGHTLFNESIQNLYAQDGVKHEIHFKQLKTIFWLQVKIV